MYRKIIPKKVKCNVHLITKKPKDDKTVHKEKLNHIKKRLLPFGLNLTFEFASKHARYFEANNGWKIKWDFGLDIFKKSNFKEGKGYLYPQKERHCKEFDMTFVQK